jgi:flagellar export protein FliJ
MAPLAVLARLAGLEVERDRRALAALDDQLDRLRRQIAEAEAQDRRERQAVVDLAGARALALYLEAQRQRRRAAEAEISRLEAARAQQLARMLASRLELKRLEVLQARQDRRRRVEAQRRERQSLDELALLTREAER